jgi:hypothetical protein
MKNRGSIVGGLILILVGALFLLLQAFPNLAAQFDPELQWPLLIVAVGALFLLGAVLGTPSLAIPGAIIGGIGGLLYYQNVSGNWDSWAYAWSLIPGFVGVGLILMGLLDHEKRSSIRDGVRLIFISFVLFAIFGGFLGGSETLGQLWPLLLILVGIWMLWRNRSGRSRVKKEPGE